MKGFAKLHHTAGVAKWQDRVLRTHTAQIKHGTNSEWLHSHNQEKPFPEREPRWVSPPLGTDWWITFYTRLLTMKQRKGRMHTTPNSGSPPPQGLREAGQILKDLFNLDIRGVWRRRKALGPKPSRALPLVVSPKCHPPHPPHTLLAAAGCSAPSAARSTSQSKALLSKSGSEQQASLTVSPATLSLLCHGPNHPVPSLARGDGKEQGQALSSRCGVCVGGDETEGRTRDVASQVQPSLSLVSSQSR